jgi:hypothetical protein
MSPDLCVQHLMYVFGRPGLSAPRGCATTFQNITLRGVAPGSGQSQSFFGFEGQIELQLLLDTGIAVTVLIDISRFVSMISVDGRGLVGRTRTCRASEYWPVLDPFGTSLPIRPFFLSPWAAANDDDAAGRSMCEAGTRTFGPTTWATVMLDLDNTDSVVVESLSIEFDAPQFADTVVYFINRDSVTGEPSQTLPSGGADKKAVWWHADHPYLNFRDLSALLRQYNQTGEVITFQNDAGDDLGSVPMDTAVALTPGAIGVTTSAALTWNTRLRQPDGSLGGQVTLRTRLVLDKLLSDRDVAGIHFIAKQTIVAKTDSTRIAIVLSGGLLVGVVALFIVFLSVDTSKPLPSWIPNAEELRNVILRTAGAGESAEQAAAKARKAAHVVSEVEGIAIVAVK